MMKDKFRKAYFTFLVRCGTGMNDLRMDEQLHIKTTGRDDSRANTFNYPYEPTDYKVLERLAAGLFQQKIFND